MAKVICTLPNASTQINGVKFVEHKLGMISEEIDDDVVISFTRIEGYVVAEGKKGAGKKTADTSAAQLLDTAPDETSGADTDTNTSGAETTAPAKE